MDEQELVREVVSETGISVDDATQAVQIVEAAHVEAGSVRGTADGGAESENPLAAAIVTERSGLFALPKPQLLLRSHRH